MGVGTLQSDAAGAVSLIAGISSATGLSSRGLPCRGRRLDVARVAARSAVVRVLMSILVVRGRVGNVGWIFLEYLVGIDGDNREFFNMGDPFSW